MRRRILILGSQLSAAKQLTSLTASYLMLLYLPDMTFRQTSCNVNESLERRTQAFLAVLSCSNIRDWIIPGTLRLGPHERTKCVRCNACRDVRCRNRKKPIDLNVRGTRALLHGRHDVS
jgi:hypothetical protein